MSDASDDGWEWRVEMRRMFDELRRSRDEAFIAQHQQQIPPPDPDWREMYRQAYGSLPDFPFEPGPVGRGGPLVRDHRPLEVDPGVWRQQQAWDWQREMHAKYFGAGGSDEG